jgi:hypothetical protein
MDAGSSTGGLAAEDCGCTGGVWACETVVAAKVLPNRPAVSRTVANLRRELNLSVPTTARPSYKIPKATDGKQKFRLDILTAQTLLEVPRISNWKLTTKWLLVRLYQQSDPARLLMIVRKSSR